MSGLGETVRIGSHLDSLSAEIFQARIAAHAKHGENSIERVGAWDTGSWLAILGEEYGEVCRALTYDSTGDLRSELIDLITVATAWIHRLDQVPDVVEATIHCGAMLDRATEHLECELESGHDGAHKRSHDGGGSTHWVEVPSRPTGGQTA